MQAITENGKNIVLDDSAEIHRGGEGRILLVKELPNQVAKIYHDFKLPIRAEQKKALQVLDNQFFIKPNELIFDISQKNILGFTMDYLGQDYQQLVHWFGVQFCLRNQIDTKRKIALLKILLQAVESAHQQHIVIGDLSGLNILVNSADNIKFIDTDAYQTAAQPHSHFLLEDIIDYYYNGTVSQNSDYFALAVIAFTMFTFVHPFKGVHKIYKSLRERMIHRIPVFANDKDLIVPKFFNPVQDATLQKQFEKIFAHSERFLLVLDQLQALQTPIRKAVPVLAKSKLRITTVYQAQDKEIVEHIFATSELLLVKSSQKYRIFDVSNQGYALLKHEFERTDFDELFVGEKQILAKKDEKLLVYQAQKWQILQNAHFTENSRWVQYKNLLAVVEDNYLKYWFLDEINKDFVRIEQTQAFGKGIKTNNEGLWQIAGGKPYIFYHSGKNLSSVLASQILYQVRLSGNHGIVSYRKQAANEASIEHAFFSLVDMQFRLSAVRLENSKSLAYKAINSHHGLIFEPHDDKLLIRRSEDFAVIQDLECSVLSSESAIFATKAGILVLENNQCYLLNT